MNYYPSPNPSLNLIILHNKLTFKVIFRLCAMNVIILVLLCLNDSIFSKQNQAILHILTLSYISYEQYNINKNNNILKTDALEYIEKLRI